MWSEVYFLGEKATLLQNSQWANNFQNVLGIRDFRSQGFFFDTQIKQLDSLAINIVFKS